jgi:glucan 1,3-beta-glucosidase
MDYGAKGDGDTDDWKAFRDAMADGDRCGSKCNGTSAKGAIVYVPEGKYLISRPIMMFYFTFLVGDATPNKRPTIIGSNNFEGIALIDTNQYIDGGNGTKWYENSSKQYGA